MTHHPLFHQSSLCVVGNINADIKTSPFAPGDFLFRDGETSVERIIETIGGGGANCAFAAATLGAQVGFIGKVGADPLGDRIAAALARAGIASYLQRSPLVATGRSIALTYSNGHRHFVSHLPNNESLEWGDIDPAAIPQYNHLLRADIWFSEKMLYGGNEILFRAAREAGIATSIDLNWDPKWGHAPADEIHRRKQAVRDILPLVTMAHGNINELNLFCESNDPHESLRRLEKWGATEVVVHMGKEGSGFWSKGHLTTAPAFPIGKIVQSTGTGDILSVCMMLLRDNPMPVEEKLAQANQIVADFMEGKETLLLEI